MFTSLVGQPQKTNVPSNVAESHKCYYVDFVNSSNQKKTNVLVTAHVKMLLEKDRAENIQQLSPEWHAIRKNFITASNVATIIGVAGAFETKTELLRKKLQLPVPRPASDFGSKAMDHGVRNEAPALRKYEQRVGKLVLHLGMMRSLNDNEEILAGSPDGITQDGVLVEMKCPWTRTPTDKVPEYYVPQIQFLMHIMNVEKCDFVQFVPGNSWTEELMIITRVTRDRQWFEEVRPKLVEFHSHMVRLRAFPRHLLEYPDDDERLDPLIRITRRKKRAAPVVTMELEEDEPTAPAEPPQPPDQEIFAMALAELQAREERQKQMFENFFSSVVEAPDPEIFNMARAALQAREEQPPKKI